MAVSAADLEKILERIDRSSPDSLLMSLVEELVLLQESHRDLQARITAMEVFQGIGDRVLTDSTKVRFDLPTAVTIDGAFSLSSKNGFYGVEYDHTGGPYRWTGPDPTFHFEVMVDRKQKLDLRLRYSQLFVHLPDTSVRCFVDGIEVEGKTIVVDREFELRALIPEREKFGATVLTFVCPGVQSPMEAGMSDDMRKLGLAFRWLKLDLPPGAAAPANAS